MDKIHNARILIDTNVPVYCWDKDFSKGAKKLLRTLKDNKNSLAISLVSCFELIKNAQDAKAREYYLDLINYLTHPSIY